MEVRILGSGTSMGVPMVGCSCQVCSSTDPKDKRSRTSVLIKENNVDILIDTSIDYRQQMLEAGTKKLDAVIYTHYHVDHILGLDDLRSFNILNQAAIPIYANMETMKVIKRVFAYAFEGMSIHGIPRIKPIVIDNSVFNIKGIDIIPIPLLHGDMQIFGFRLGNFAYCTDASKIPDESFTLLKDLDVLILNALRFKTHPTHFSVDEAVLQAQKICAKRTFLTHISHAIPHHAEKDLPQNINLAYDGLMLSVD